MKTVFVLFAIIGMAIGMEGCGTIQKVSDVMNAVENQRSECYGGVDRLAAKGVTLPGIDKATCDKAINKVEGSITDVLSKIRAALNKAGV
jgi:uncharacterized protein YceK